MESLEALIKAGANEARKKAVAAGLPIEIFVVTLRAVSPGVDRVTTHPVTDEIIAETPDGKADPNEDLGEGQEPGNTLVEINFVDSFDQIRLDESFFADATLGRSADDFATSILSAAGFPPE